jgi:hypothetical protein
MDLLKIKSALADIAIELPNSDRSKWVSYKTENVVFNKEASIVSLFENDFPTQKLIGKNEAEKYLFLTRLISRNIKIGIWYGAAKSKYADFTQLPLYLKKYVTPAEYKKLGYCLDALKRSVVMASENRAKAAEEYKLKLAKIDDIETSDFEIICGDSNLMRIVTLQSSALPLSLAMAIEGFSPAGDSSEEEVAESRKQFAKESLISFKIAILEALVIKKDINVSRLLEDIALK